MAAIIDTDGFSKRLRAKAVRVDSEEVLIARLTGSSQEQDLTEPVNCDGYGRIRNFRFQENPGWSPDPLPILPAAKALGYPPAATLRAQVFQNSACNWRCWYCFVDFDRLSANPQVSRFFTCDQLIDLFLAEPERSSVIDLSGGQPDLTPEWVPWMMRTLSRRGLSGSIFLWSDDNLSGSYYWDYLSPEDRRLVATYPMYARVCCFKGYDEHSFSFNTMADGALFKRQFEIFERLLHEGLDLYAYVTFTAPPHADPERAVERFVDQLQHVAPNLPLRTVPLKIRPYSPTAPRMQAVHNEAVVFQEEVHSHWRAQLEARFSAEMRSLPITDIPLRSR